MSDLDRAILAIRESALHDIIEDHTQLKKIVGDLEKSISNLPTKIDDNLQEKIENLVKCAGLIDSNIHKAKQDAIRDIRQDLDQIKIDAVLTIQKSTTKVFEPSISKFDDTISESKKMLIANVEELKKLIKQAEKLKPPKNRMGITVVLCLVCSLLTAGGVFLGNKYINSYRTEQLEHVLSDVDQAARKAANVLTTNQKSKFLKQYERYLGI